MFVSFEETNIFEFELYRLFSVIPCTLYGVFANLEKVVECYEREVTNGL